MLSFLMPSLQPLSQLNYCPIIFFNLHSSEQLKKYFWSLAPTLSTAD